ncbi:MAG: hypothetical protein ACKOQY_07095 [Bacteroidota bacterium]
MYDYNRNWANNQMKKLNWIFDTLLSNETRVKIERVFLVIALISFVLHLSLICLVKFGVVSLSEGSDLLTNPISAIYTPFSFILVYEVYLLIYFLPKSLTTYINKQYEIILLIIIRRLFKDLSSLKISSDWFVIKNDLQFTFDIITSIVLFFLIFHFYKQSNRKFPVSGADDSSLERTRRYMKIKRAIASSLVPLILILAIYSFVNWLGVAFFKPEGSAMAFTNINNVFFEEFFTILVLVDVVLLLVSFFYTDRFHLIIRNSGFIISTILIRISFSTEGVMNNILVVVAVLFGLAILNLYNSFEKALASEGSDRMV